MPAGAGAHRKRMSPPPQRASKASTSKVVGLIWVATLLVVYAAAVVGAFAVLVRDPEVVGWALLAGFIAGLVLGRNLGDLSAVLAFAFFVGLFLAILGLGAYAAFVFLGVSSNVALGLFCGAIGLTFLFFVWAMSARGPDDYDD
jgi:hypothetical protein